MAGFELFTVDEHIIQNLQEWLAFGFGQCLGKWLSTYQAVFSLPRLPTPFSQVSNKEPGIPEQEQFYKATATVWMKSNRLTAAGDMREAPERQANTAFQRRLRQSGYPRAQRAIKFFELDGPYQVRLRGIL